MIMAQAGLDRCDVRHFSYRTGDGSLSLGENLRREVREVGTSVVRSISSVGQGVAGLNRCQGEWLVSVYWVSRGWAGEAA
jgi:hypothetical protein